MPKLISAFAVALGFDWLNFTYYATKKLLVNSAIIKFYIFLINSILSSFLCLGFYIGCIWNALFSRKFCKTISALIPKSLFDSLVWLIVQIFVFRIFIVFCLASGLVWVPAHNTDNKAVCGRNFPRRDVRMFT